MGKRIAFIRGVASETVRLAVTVGAGRTEGRPQRLLRAVDRYLDAPDTESFLQDEILRFVARRAEPQDAAEEAEAAVDTEEFHAPGVEAAEEERGRYGQDWTSDRGLPSAEAIAASIWEERATAGPPSQFNSPDGTRTTAGLWRCGWLFHWSIQGEDLGMTMCLCADAMTFDPDRHAPASWADDVIFRVRQRAVAATMPSDPMPVAEDPLAGKSDEEVVEVVERWLAKHPDKNKLKNRYAMRLAKSFM